MGKAAQYLRVAADAGNVEAMIYLSKIYIYDLIEDKSHREYIKDRYDKAFKYMKSCVD